MRIAFIHDWLLTWRGGEKCLEEILPEFPDADIYTIFADPVLIKEKLAGRIVHVSFLSYLPLVKKYYRYLLPLYPLAIWNLSRKLRTQHKKEGYDHVVSISHCAVKNIKVPDQVPHTCYCLTPVRYIWDQYDAYFKDVWFEPIIRLARWPFQRWDIWGAKNVTTFIAISEFVAGRIKKYYGRDSHVIYPPVDTERFMKLENKGKDPGFFVMLNALVPYKNTALVIEACKNLGVELRIIGDGPQRAFLESIADPNIHLLGWVSDEVVDRVLSECKGLIYAAVEDFGIAPVEAQAAGKPVIVLNFGGCSETAIFAHGPQENQGITAVAIKHQDKESVIEAINTFEELYKKGYFKHQKCRESASRFSVSKYRESFKQKIMQC